MATQSLFYLLFLAFSLIMHPQDLVPTQAQQVDAASSFVLKRTSRPTGRIRWTSTAKGRPG